MPVPYIEFVLNRDLNVLLRCPKAHQIPKYTYFCVSLQSGTNIKIKIKKVDCLLNAREFKVTLVKCMYVAWCVFLVFCALVREQRLIK